jgi:SEC-C motif-containing protein
MNKSSCPCESGLPYAACCGALHRAFDENGRLQARTAEALMRSRYSAYVLNLLPYLRASWHHSTRPAELAPNEPGLKWLGLQIKQRLQQDESHASVAFVARSKLAGRAFRLQELSRFVREDGQWFYVDGDIS